MSHRNPLVPIFLTALLLALAIGFGLLAALPSGQSDLHTLVAALAGGLWLAAAAWSGRPLVAYLMHRRRYRFALSGE